MRHTRLGRFSLPEQVFMIIFCTFAVIFIVCRALDLLCKMNSCQASSVMQPVALPSLCPCSCPPTPSPALPGSPIHPQEGSPWLCACPWGLSELLQHAPLLHRAVPPLALVQLWVPGCSVRAQGDCGTHTHGSACAGCVRGTRPSLEAVGAR